MALLRKLLLLLPAFGLWTMALFWLLDAHLPGRDETESLPRFVELAPRTLESEASRALSELKSDASKGQRSLESLGSAGLVHLQGKLPSMDLETKRRFAVAAWPILEKMMKRGVSLEEVVGPRGADARNLATSDDRLALLERYLSERSHDFRPLSVARLAQRIADRAGKMRAEELLSLDTYCVPHLMKQIGTVRTLADIARVERIAAIISEILGEDYRVKATSLEAAQSSATKLRRMWDLRGDAFVTHDAISLLLLPLEQTRFALWLRRSYREAMGLDSSPDLERLERSLSASRTRIILSGLGMLVIGPLLSTLLLSRRIRQSDRSGQRFDLRITLALLLSTSCLILPQSEFASGALLLWCTVWVTVLHLTKDAGSRLHWRERYVLSQRSTVRRLTSLLSSTLPLLPTLAPVLLPWCLFLCFSTESLRGSVGLGAELLLAARQGDLGFLMLASLLLTLILALLQLLSDSAYQKSQVILRRAR